MMCCTREGCDVEASCAPLVCVPSLSGTREIRFVLRLPVCVAHGSELSAAPMLDDCDAGGRLLRAEVTFQAGGRFVPDFAAAHVEAVGLDSPEWRLVERAGRRQ